MSFIYHGVIGSFRIGRMSGLLGFEAKRSRCPLLARRHSGGLDLALTQHLFHLLLDLLHPLGPLVPHRIFVILIHGCVAHEGNQAYVEEVGDVRAVAVHDVSVTVTVVEVNLQQVPPKLAGAHHAAVVDIQGHVLLALLVNLFKVIHVFLRLVRVLLCIFKHFIEGAILGLDALLVLAIVVVHLIDADLHEALLVLLRNATQLAVDLLKVLIQRVALLVHQAPASHSDQRGDDAEDGVEGRGERRDFLHAAQHLDYRLLDLRAVSHDCCCRSSPQDSREGETKRRLLLARSSADSKGLECP